MSDIVIVDYPDVIHHNFGHLEMRIWQEYLQGMKTQKLSMNNYTHFGARGNRKKDPNEPVALEEFWAQKFLKLPVSFVAPLGFRERESSKLESLWSNLFQKEEKLKKAYEVEGWVIHLINTCAQFEVQQERKRLTTAMRQYRRYTKHGQRQYDRISNMVNRRVWVRVRNILNQYRDDLYSLRTIQLNNISLVELDQTEL